MQNRNILQLQDREIAILQIARQEYCSVTGCKIGWLVTCNLQDKNIAKLQFAR